MNTTARASARTFLLGLVAIATAAIVAVGCYTIIRHPAMKAEVADVGGYEHAQSDKDCLRCHQDYGSYPYGHYYEYYPDYYWRYERWGSYNAYPWWWDDLWYGSSAGSPVSVDTVDQIEKPERRRGIPPPFVTDSGRVMPPSSWGSDPNSPPPTTGGTTTGGTSTGTTNPPGNTNNPAKEEKKDEKPPRRRGK